MKSLLKMKINSIVIPYKGRFKGLQCQVVEMSAAGLIKIVHGNQAAWEWSVDLEVV